MDKEQLKELIQSVYDDYDFANFNLHFVNCIEPHKVYDIKNNYINNKLKDTTVIDVRSQLSNKEINLMSLYGVDVQEHIAREMIYESANKILFDVYKVTNKSWSHPVEIEMTIANWSLFEQKNEDNIIYILRFEVA